VGNVLNLIPLRGKNTNLTYELSLIIVTVLLVYKVLRVPRATLAGQGRGEQGWETWNTPAPSHPNHLPWKVHLDQRVLQMHQSKE
jgi:hypothetical protein